MLRRELSERLAGELEARQRAYRAAHEAATHEESKPENDKDTRALEQSYLARGEAMRVEQLRVAIEEVSAMTLRSFGENEPAALGAVVEIEEASVTTTVWLAPHGGGQRLAGGSIHVVTPKSPLGRALTGARTGESCEVVLAGKTRALTIAAIW